MGWLKKNWKWLVAVLAVLLVVAVIIAVIASGNSDPGTDPTGNTTQPSDPQNEVNTYTVTFNTNGGTTIASVKVAAGETVSRPADPEKEGYIFAGWYTDLAYTKTFGFDADVINGNTTIYARWLKAFDGNSEFTVDFDLGYDAEPLESMTTVSGRLTGVPTPEREGYIFVGWWISMTEQADKLTYMYSEEVLFDANTTLFALWVTDPEGGKLAAPLPEVYSNLIKWNTVEGAVAYNLKIVDAEGNVILEERLGTTVKVFDFDARAAGSYTVEVTAIGATSEQNSKTTNRNFVNKMLPRVSLFVVAEGDILQWNAVKGAEKYLITIDCGNDEHNHTEFDNGTSTIYNFSNCAMQPGGIRFTVTAVAEGYASSVSETFVLDRSLDAVGQIAYDEKTETFSWNEVKNAEKYLITVTVGGVETVVDNGTATSYCIKYLTGDITVNVVPVTVGYNSPEPSVATCKKTSLPAPQGMKVSGYILSWDAVDGATGYTVKVNDQTFESLTNTLDLSTLDIKFDSDSAYDISVMANGAENSLYCDSMVAKHASEIDSVTYSDKTVTWTPVIGVDNFEVRVNGEVVATVSGNNSAAVTLTKAGVNTIEIRYTDLGGSNWAKTEVTAHTVTYNSDSAVTEYLAKGDTMLLPTPSKAGYDFTGWYNLPQDSANNGAPYTDTKLNVDSDLALYPHWKGKTYHVEFVGMGNDVANMADGDKAPVTYNSAYQLPVPNAMDTLGYFIGWYTGPAGTGTKLTDNLGNSLANYDVIGDSVAYPFFESSVLTYELQKDGTYGVKKGPYIDAATSVRVSEYYRGIPVTTILDNAFYGASGLEKVEIPATIKTVGAGAIPNTTDLKEIVVYTDTDQQNYEIYYSSHEGALLRHDLGTVYLEMVPRGKTGEFTVPENVNAIRDQAFYRSQLTKVTVGSNVSLIMKNVFYQCTNLETLSFIPGGSAILNIESGAFYGTKNITSLYLPGRLGLMDLSAFNQFTKLATLEMEANGTNYSVVENMICDAAGTTLMYVPASVHGELTIPRGIREIGAGALSYNANLTKITIPSYVNVIGNDAFLNCTGIKEVIVEGARTNDLLIGENAFNGCTALISVTFKGNGTSTLDTGAVTISAGAFKGNTLLKNLTFERGSSVAAIGNEAFMGCGLLETATIPASIQSVGNSAFADCTNLKTVVFESSSKEVTFGDSVFANCEDLKTIQLPSFVSYFKGTVFKGCLSVTEIIVDEANPNLMVFDGALYSKDGTELIFYPTALIGENLVFPDNLKIISDNLFEKNTTIKSVTFGKGIEVIGNSAFNECSNLTTITFSAETKNLTIGERAFRSCNVLTKLELPAGTVSIGNLAFANDSGIQSLTFIGNASGNLTIGNQVFYGCSAMTTATLPEGTTSIGEQVFYNCKALAIVTLPSTITSLGYRAFCYCPMTAITLPDSLVTIGQQAFYNCNKLSSISIPKNVEYIGSGAFGGCSKLVSITFEAGGTAPLTIGDLEGGSAVFYNGVTALELPDRLTAIGKDAFKSMNKLTSITIGDNSQLTTLGSGAFQNCSKLETINISKVKTVSNNAFEGCSKLTSVVLSTDLATIGDNAFYGAKLTEVTIPNTVTQIGVNAFYNCPITSLTFEQGTADLTILSNAFYGNKLTDVTLPARYANANETTTLPGGMATGTKKVITSIFANSSTLQNVYVESGHKTLKSIDGVLYEINENGVAETLLFCPPAKTGTITISKEVRLIVNGAFYNSKLTAVVFEEYDTNDPNYGKPLLSIGDWTAPDGLSTPGHNNSVFTGCSNLTSITMPSHLKCLGVWAFSEMGNLNSLTFNSASKLEFIESRALYKSGLTSLSLPSVGYIGVGAFMGNSSLANVTFSEGLEVIAINAFNSCSALNKIQLPASVVTIGNNAFKYCSGLTSITTADGSKLKNIGDYAFENTALTEFTIPDTVETIGANPFAGCSSLKTVTLSANLKAISPKAFYNCTTLENIYVADGSNYFKSVNGVLYSFDGTVLYSFPRAKSTDDFTIPEDVTTIGAFAFYGFQGTSLTLPEGLKTIEQYAFYSSKLSAIHIPANVVSIGDNAFTSNTGLATLTFATNSKLTSIGASAFYENTALSVLVLPDSLKTLGEKAFHSCSGLKEITLSASLEAINTWTFYNCTNVEKFVMKEGLQTIGDRIFGLPNKGTDANKVTEIVIPSTVTYIEYEAFSKWTSLKTVTFAEGSKLEAFEYSVFSDCTALESITLPASIQGFGANNKGVSLLFNGCTALKFVDLSACANLTTLPKQMFNNCTGLETMLLPTNLEALDMAALGDAGLPALKNITIPKGITALPDNAFNGYQYLETVTFESGSPITELGTGVFANTPALKTVILPEELKVIGESCFENSAVANVPLPSSVSVIQANAFKNCDNLVSVYLTANLSYLGDEAFSGCDRLEAAPLYFNLTYLGDLAFKDCVSLKQAYIPACLLEMEEENNPYSGCTGLESISLDPEHPLFVLIDGVLYAEDKTTVLLAPKTGE